MNDGWTVKTLAELCEFRNGLWKGKRPPYLTVGVIRNTNFSKSGFLDDSDIAYLAVEEKQFTKRKLKHGDIILEKSGGGPKQPVGRVMLFEKTEGLFSFSNFTSVIRILDPSLLSSRFLHRLLDWYYRSGKTEAMQMHSTGIRNLHFNTYKQLHIPLPPLTEQVRIVAILDEAFTAIDKAIANTEKNLVNARELFDSELNRVFSQKGEGWFSTTIGDQATLKRGFDITKRQQVPGQIPVVSSGGVKSYHNKAMVEGPGVVIGRKGSIGQVYFIEENFWPHDTTLWVTSFRDNNPKFVYYFFKSMNLAKLDSGAANPALNRNLIHPQKVSWPKTKLQPALVHKLDNILFHSTCLSKQCLKKLTTLTELKQSILQKAFTGELTADSKAAELSEAGV